MKPRHQCVLWIIIVLMIGGLGMSRPARAALLPTVTCANPTINNVQFGAVDLTTATVPISGSIAWSCTSAGVAGLLLAPQANITMCLSLNAGTGGTQLNPRLLSNGSSTLQYQLFTDSGHAIIWSSTATTTPLMIQVSIPATLLFSNTQTGSTPFYAQLPGGQTTATTGAYSSTLIASVIGSYTTSQNTPIATCTGGLRSALGVPRSRYPPR
ncbi:hypothetical protein CS053_06690 [Rhodanobacter glycinis]|uniref:Spore coat protein U/FanG domain-containing protein n=2 Tax=Rhodanobacter glycinis TaxID=582702 RepID=A0A5B9E0H5_9GAMM|nr:hypothetical protein CS053_06690 [Rhodanobacter glycinis]